MTTSGLTREEIETALDAGRLEVRVSPARFWRARRNGMTKTWKRDPERYSIPIKAGFRLCGRIEPGADMVLKIV